MTDTSRRRPGERQGLELERFEVRTAQPKPQRGPEANPGPGHRRLNAVLASAGGSSLILIGLHFAISYNKVVVLRSLVRALTFLRALAGIAPGETRRDF